MNVIAHLNLLINVKKSHNSSRQAYNAPADYLIPFYTLHSILLNTL